MEYSMPPPVGWVRVSALVERHEAFAYDLVFVVATECKCNWTPFGWAYYCLGPMSPMTPEFIVATRHILRTQEESYCEEFLKIGPNGTDTVDASQLFADYARNMLKESFDKGCPPGYTIVGVARISFMFYQRGVHMAPNLAVAVISEALLWYMERYGAGFHQDLSDSMKQVIADGGPE